VSTKVRPIYGGGVPDQIFANPRLAEIYDDLESDRSDLDHYVAMVEEFGAQSVLDVGCGTGTLACLLAAKGIDVTGVDPAEASLAVARRKPAADTVRWILGVAADLPPLNADLAIMTGNVAQVFVSDTDWLANLVGIRNALQPTGRLVFEVRDPAQRDWEHWTREKSFCRLDVAGVDSWVELTDVALPLVSFKYTFRFDDGSLLASDSTLRFRQKDEVVASLAETGFEVVDVRDAPDRPGAEFVLVADVADQALYPKTDLVSRNSSMPLAPHSRPLPDCL
jgi:SAM-dependent methyltransferase